MYYNLIFCEKCKKQFEQDLFYCKKCCNKENDKEVKNRMLYGKCKRCYQACTDDDWCSYCGFQNNNSINKQIVFKAIDYNMNLNDRKAKYEKYDIFFCEKCKKQFEEQDLFYCKNCCNIENDD